MTGESDKLQALAQIIERRRRELLAKLAWAMPPQLKRTVALEDILQEAFIDVRADLDRFEKPSESVLFSMIMRSVRSLAIDAAKREFCVRRGAGRIEYPSELIAMDHRTPSRVVARREAVSAMIQKLDGLTERQLRIVRLRFVCGLRLAEIAELVGASSNSVNLVLLRARQRLAALMGPAERYFTDA